VKAAPVEERDREGHAKHADARADAEHAEHEAERYGVHVTAVKVVLLREGPRCRILTGHGWHKFEAATTDVERCGEGEATGADDGGDNPCGCALCGAQLWQVDVEPSVATGADAACERNKRVGRRLEGKGCVW